jgi:hypothetical protein
MEVKMNRQEIICSNGKSAYLYRGHPKAECPKSYKKVTVISHNIGNAYNSELLTIFRAKDKTLRYEIYRDGCFYPYYGKFEYVN